ncbi:translational activator of cytochrome c oxidase 1-like [Trichogramma pretiosum]|uniref:translational activator of cytochrome c oxidase 1-like n=1 Tax=Trichogramma pretiosum TaxID=7493 RepID=UPI0006C94EDF|nr:translational activator of cytochrome c oxidase 1-like [Trichogramma pretiosum]
MTSLIRYALRTRRNVIVFTESKRFAGHSKWQNIKHTKMAKDAERANALQSHIKKMRYVIAEMKSADPDHNPKLARLIEQAKKNNLPQSSIKGFIEKMQKDKSQMQTAVFESRGPSGSTVLIQSLTDNFKHTKQMLNQHLKKCLFSQAETPSNSSYKERGIILTEIDGRDMNKVTEDAIEVGAEEVEQQEENDKKFLEFTCDAMELMKVRNKLEGLNYKVIQADVDYIPETYVELNDNEMEAVSKLYERLNNLEEVIKVYNNIA